MPSGKKSKQQRRTAASAPPPVQSRGSARRRQADPKVLAIAGGIAALLVIGVVLGVVLTRGGGSSGIPEGTPTTGSVATGLPGASDVEELIGGLPQDGLYLGSPKAAAEMMIFIDLQCPFCQAYETEVLPEIIDDYVRPGKLRLQVQPWAFIGPDSTRGQQAMFAAAEQDRAWNFSDVLFLNQGTENTGWLTDTMIAQAAASVPGLNVPKLFEDRNSAAVKQQAKDVANLAKERGVTGTPTVFVGEAGKTLKRVGGASVPDLAQTREAIDTALGR